ncbi:trypsin eta [Stomoxys calcitrans]|uniref:trypsin eta n=1 Tax=Stomoxys calcitrans TaxID=35570 RepID=UPI0027E34C1A|nr:trypsin eta [Stomoxys calcitrans]
MKILVSFSIILELVLTSEIKKTLSPIFKIMRTYKQGLVGLLSLVFFLMTVNALPTSGQSRIISGTEVDWESTRYQVSVRNQYIDSIFFGAGHLCGGTLVARNLVLTAAHCIWDEQRELFRAPNEFVVVMGNVDRLKKTGSLKIGVRSIIIGPRFNTSTYRDDIAIMVLNESIPLNYQRASIMPLNDKPNLREGTSCTVSGWGITEKGHFSRKLRHLEAPIINRNICANNYGHTTILPGMMCAGYLEGIRDACIGDSGGPLVCDNKLVGIVSFGIGCALPDYPGVYTNVADYIDWYRNNTASIQDRGIMANYTTTPNNTIVLPHRANSSPIGCSKSSILVMVPLLSILYKFLALL